MPSALNDDLMPLEKAPVQAYFSNRIQLGDVIEWVLDQTGPADIVISTFSTSEEFIRRIFRLRKEGKVSSCELFCDMRAARKTILLADFMKSVFSSVYLTENHSKVVLIRGRSEWVSVITSQNQTRGDRWECGSVTVGSDMYNRLLRGFSAMRDNSVSIDVLL